MWKRISKLFSNLQAKHWLIIILLISSLLRFIHLGSPPTYIFDEVYHAFTARELLHGHIEAWEWWTTPPEGVAYEWTHPPVAKYGMVLGMIIFGENSFGWRVGSAVSGVVSLVGIYYLTLVLTRSPRLSILSVFLVSIEGLHISQSRVGMNDAYMLNFLVWSLYFAASRRWKVSAILYGLALSSKWSALYGTIPLASLYLYQHGLPSWSTHSLVTNLFSPVRLLLISCCIYLLSYAPFIFVGHTWEQFVELHRQMWYYHTHLVATHDYQSTPQDWIFAARPVWYHVDYQPTLSSNIYAQGNPIILWFGLIALILQLNQVFTYPFFVMVISYLIFVAPWIISPRIMFFYHYLPSATFLCLILARWIYTSLTKAQTILLIGLSILGLILVVPMLYNIPLPPNFWTHYFNIFPRWK